MKIEDMNFRENLPYTECFKLMCDAWVKKYGSKKHLADDLNLPAQKISDFYNGRRFVPWWIFAHMMRGLEVEMLVGGFGVTIRPVTRKKYDIDWRVEMPEDF